jgi:hypothetical protein
VPHQFKAACTLAWNGAPLKTPAPWHLRTLELAMARGEMATRITATMRVEERARFRTTTDKDKHKRRGETT